MKNKKYIISTLGIIYVMSILSYMKLEVVLYPLIEDPYFPLGTLTGWILLSFISVIAFFRFKDDFKSIPIYFIILICTSMALGLSWGFASRLASGNWAFEYVNIPEISRRMTLFTYLVATLQLFTLAAMPLLAFWLKRKGSS